MDSIYHPVIEEDNSSNLAVIQPRKQTQHMLSLFKTFDSALMFENVCKIHVRRIVQPLGLRKHMESKIHVCLKNNNSYLLNGHSYDF